MGKRLMVAVEDHIFQPTLERLLVGLPKKWFSTFTTSCPCLYSNFSLLGKTLGDRLSQKIAYNKSQLCKSMFWV